MTLGCMEHREYSCLDLNLLCSPSNIVYACDPRASLAWIIFFIWFCYYAFVLQKYSIKTCLPTAKNRGEDGGGVNFSASAIVLKKMTFSQTNLLLCDASRSYDRRIRVVGALDFWDRSVGVTLFLAAVETTSGDLRMSWLRKIEGRGSSRFIMKNQANNKRRNRLR